MEKQINKIVKRLIGNAKSRAKDPQKSRGNQDFDLDEAWVYEQMEAQDYRCPYTGQPYDFSLGKSWHGRSGHPGRPSINRLNPLQGYTKENCEITSNYYNTALSSWTHKDIFKYTLGMAKFMIKKRLRLV